LHHYFTAWQINKASWFFKRISEGKKEISIKTEMFLRRRRVAKTHCFYRDNYRFNPAIGSRMLSFSLIIPPAAEANSVNSIQKMG